MLTSDQVDRLLCQLAAWDPDTLVREFVAYRSRFPVDATADFLRRQSPDRLRHVFFALCVQNRRLPDGVRTPTIAA